MIEQIESIPFAHTGFFTNQPSEDLATLLMDLASEPLNHVYFVNFSPALVNSMPFKRRLNRGWPSCFSKEDIFLLTALWLTKSACAAFEKLM